MFQYVCVPHPSTKLCANREACTLLEVLRPTSACGPWTWTASTSDQSSYLMSRGRKSLSINLVGGNVSSSLNVYI